MNDNLALLVADDAFFLIGAEKPVYAFAGGADHVGQVGIGQLDGQLNAAVLVLLAAGIRQSDQGGGQGAGFAE
ncbi:hypothetical protein D3C76_1577430 [compost metagenome]